MPTPSSLETDKGYILMHEIEIHQDLSQRELSQKTGLSLGTVNLLLQKMIKKGLVKMETIPANRVVYMLTPMGIAEKTVKTIHYIKNHYQMIQEVKDKLQQKLLQFHQQYNVIYLCLPENELDILVKAAVEEYQIRYPERSLFLIDGEKVRKLDQLVRTKSTVILYLPENEQDLADNPPFSANIPIFSLTNVL